MAIPRKEGLGRDKNISRKLPHCGQKKWENISKSHAITLNWDRPLGCLNAEVFQVTMSAG